MNLNVDIYLKQGKFLLDTRFRCLESALGIFGPSGCGKSTLFRALAGLVRPDGGRIELDGRVLFDADQQIFVKPHQRNIGLVFQDARLFPHWSVEQNLRAGERRNPGRTIRPYGFDDIVELLNIGHLIGRSVELLSGGEKQRIAMGRTLLAYPKLLLMDEPVAGLDVSLKMQILPFLSKVHRILSIPTVLISHDLSELLQLTDRLLLMRDGTVVGNDPLDKLARHPTTLRELKGTDLTNLLPLRVLKHDTARGTTTLVTESNPDAVIEMELASDLDIGESVNVGIAANQIALATRRIDSISMRNQLEGRVQHIVHAADRSICHLETPLGTLFAEITPGTERDMALAENEPVWVLFKSLALQRF